MSRINSGQPGQSPSARPSARPAVSQALPGAAPNALERLEQIKEHQWNFWDDVVNNWQGWAGSAVFHLALVILFAMITWQILGEKREVWIETKEPKEKKEFSKEELKEVIKKSLVDSKIDKPASVDADVLRPNPGYNDNLNPGAPDWITAGGHLTGWGGAGGGGDHLAGQGWGGYLAGLQKDGLDIMFVFDSTGSMGGIILEVKSRIKQLMGVVTYLVPSARLGVVTYRDKKQYDLDDYEYTVKFQKLVAGDEDGLKKLQRFLRETEAYGGGDIPEAVYEGVKAAIEKAGWRQGGKKIIVVFGDAPPRPENNGLAKIYDLCREWHAKTGGIISCIDTTGNSKLMDEFRQMASEGGGESVFLNNEQAIIKQLVVFIFGSRWQEQIDKVSKKFLEGPQDTVLGE